MQNKETATKTKNPSVIITPKELLEHWQGHRRVTRRVIEAFPEDKLFDYSIGGMRPFSEMAKELLAIATPGIRQIAEGGTEELNEEISQAKNKADILRLWDESTDEINRYWVQVPEDKFHEDIITFGEYEGTVWSSIFYFIDNEIHHRGQGYVYLRSLGIEPPFFWERD